MRAASDAAAWAARLRPEQGDLADLVEDIAELAAEAAAPLIS